MTNDEKQLWFAVFGAAYVRAVHDRVAVLAAYGKTGAERASSPCSVAESVTFAEEGATLADHAVADVRETYGPGGDGPGGGLFGVGRCKGFGPEWFELSDEETAE
jgi:hypothetical protein